MHASSCRSNGHRLDTKALKKASQMALGGGNNEVEGLTGLTHGSILGVKGEERVGIHS